MAAERFYIYRCGKTEACAVTGRKGELRLSASPCQEGWQFWMQITRHQVEDGGNGFVFEAAVAGIKDNGYYLFTGSSKLLSDRHVPASEGSSNV